MNILYIAVHRHVGWGAEHWLANAFERHGCKVMRFDYRARKKLFKPWWLIRRELALIAKTNPPDVVLFQRCENMPASIASVFDCPKVFWSTEPLIRRRDVDQFLEVKGLFDWVYLHTYTCVDVCRDVFQHLNNTSSVMHNAGAIENTPGDAVRPRFAIFNRNVSPRRGVWLAAVEDLVDVIGGRYGEPYFRDLRESHIAVNIHFAEESVDDFETGIFEAMASGCCVVSETLNDKTVADMGMVDAIVQVASPEELRVALLDLQSNPEKITQLQANAQSAMSSNRWDARAEQMLAKFAEISR